MGALIPESIGQRTVHATRWASTIVGVGAATFPMANKWLPVDKPRTEPPSVDGARWIPLTKGSWTLVDEADYVELSQYSWSLDSEGYARRRIVTGAGKYSGVRMHKTILEAEEVDHWDNNRLNNRRNNLRPCTRTQNNQNARKRKGTTSIYKGVSWKTGRHNCWKSSIKINRKQVHLGYYHDEIEAAKAYEPSKRGGFEVCVVSGCTERFPCSSNDCAHSDCIEARNKLPKCHYCGEIVQGSKGDDWCAWAIHGHTRAVHYVCRDKVAGPAERARTGAEFNPT